MIEHIAHLYRGKGPGEFPNYIREHLWMRFENNKPFVGGPFLTATEVKAGQYVVWHARGLLTLADKLGEDQ